MRYFQKKMVLTQTPDILVMIIVELSIKWEGKTVRSLPNNIAPHPCKRIRGG